MSILVINAGSSSLKLSLFSLPESRGGVTADAIWKAQVSWSGTQYAELVVESREKERKAEEIDGADRVSVTRAAFELLWRGEHAVLSGPSDVRIVGHRIVHGGTKYATAVIVDRSVLQDLRSYVELAPAHEPFNIEGIQISQELIAGVPHVAVFDTAFYHHVPAASCVYAGPYSWYEEKNLRRIGFHGISHQYCSRHAAELAGGDLASLRIIVCHLGNGASLSAVKGGGCVMTTMGFTALEGLVMGRVVAR